MKTIIILLMLISTSVAIAQAPIILSDRQRKNIIIATDEALDLWAPGYNQHYGVPTIENDTTKDTAKKLEPYNNSIKSGDIEYMRNYEWVGQVINGRKYYIVTYHYGPTVEAFSRSFAAKVYIWADETKVFRISLGSDITLYGLDKPQTKGKTPIVSPHVPQKPPKSSSSKVLATNLTKLS